MKNTKTILIASCLMLALTGCGLNVVTPEENVSKNTGTGAGVVVERTCTINELDRCVAQFQLINNDLNTCMAATQKCEKNLQAYVKRVSEDHVKIDKLKGIFKN